MTPTSARTIVRAGSDIDRSQCAARRHGSESARHHHGCTCPDAEQAERLAIKRRRLGLQPPGRVPATGSIRRLQALAAQGHPTAVTARQLGWSIRYTLNLRGGHTGQQILRKKAEQLRALCDAVMNERGPDAKLARHAARSGWATLAQWDGVDIDDPAEKSDLAYLREPEPVPDIERNPVWEDVEYLMGYHPLPPPVDHPWTDEFRARDEMIAKQLKTTAAKVRRCRAAAGRASGRRAKLTDHDVHEIRRRYLAEVVTGQLQLAQLADAYHVSPSLLVRVLTGAARPHLQLDDIQVDLRKIRTTSTTSPIPTSTVPTNQRDAGRTSESADAASARSEVAA